MDLHLSDRHILALNMLLVVVLAYFAALAVNDLVALRRTPNDATVARVHGRTLDDSTSNRPRAAYQSIVERDIFNLEPPPAAPVEVVVEDLHLTLIGVSQSTKGKPFAIVADQRGEQSVYRVGEIIPGSGKLLEVGKDSAVIEHGGKHVSIALAKDDLSGDGDSGDGAVPEEGLTPAEASSRDQMHHRLRRHHTR